MDMIRKLTKRMKIRSAAKKKMKAKKKIAKIETSQKHPNVVASI